MYLRPKSINLTNLKFSPRQVKPTYLGDYLTQYKRPKTLGRVSPPTVNNFLKENARRNQFNKFRKQAKSYPSIKPFKTII